MKSAAPSVLTTVQPLLLPVLLLGASLALLDKLTAGVAGHLLGVTVSPWMLQMAQVACACALVFGCCRLLDIVLWNRMARKRGRAVPSLLKDFVATMVWVCTAFMVSSLVFDRNLTAVLTASTVFMGIIGLALQRPIMDAFSGVILSFQGPFGIGDWIKIDDSSEALGRVTEITWRAVHLITVDEVTCIVPNHDFVNKTVKVYTRPDFFFRDTIRITLPYSVSAERAQRLLIGAANQVPECAAIPRKATISVVEYSDSGILWRLSYWCPDGRLELWRFKVHQSVQRSLFYASVAVPAPMLNVQPCTTWPHEVPDVHKGHEGHEGHADAASARLLHNLPLFASLTDEEFQFLLARAPTVLCRAGDAILQQGQAGDSLFIVQEGALTVSVRDGAGHDKQVATLGPGHFFGERSLLMGEPRGASVTAQVDTVVVEIGRAAIAPLLKARPALMEFLSKVLAERDAANASLLKAHNDQHAAAQPTLAAHIFKQISAFFS